MKNILYLGLDPSRFPHPVTHYPIIEIVPRTSEELKPHFLHLKTSDWVIFTSQTTVKICMSYTGTFPPAIVIGKATKAYAQRYGIDIAYTAQQEQGEGVLEILKKVRGSFFYPHSSQARPLLIDYLKKRTAYTFPLYDPRPTKRTIDLSPYATFVFTSPSTVDAFLHLYGALPMEKELIALGPITEARLQLEMEKRASPDREQAR